MLSCFSFFPTTSHHVIVSRATAPRARGHVHRTDTYQTFLLNKELVFKFENLHRDGRFDQHARNVVVDHHKG